MDTYKVLLATFSQGKAHYRIVTAQGNNPCLAAHTLSFTDRSSIAAMSDSTGALCYAQYAATKAQLGLYASLLK